MEGSGPTNIEGEKNEIRDGKNGRSAAKVGRGTRSNARRRPSSQPILAARTKFS